MFSKLLVANRGEIALRIIQTCRQMGIQTVAVYSSADRAALHVQLADEAYCLGGGPAAESYLNPTAILRAVRESGAEAVHPGYGFLAENVEFARLVEETGAAWIGPPAEAIALMGDKAAAKELAASAGVPVVPGYQGEDRSTPRMQAEAQRIGYPVMIKAAAGGGGRGMRSVWREEDFADALEGARREASSTFGDDRVFVEKLLANPRHIEIQVLADVHGNAVHLGERECSIQRRHQKVVEEAPSPVVTQELRNAMGRDALRLVRASGYANAGTIEFLFSGDAYYFLEMNTRIQVEHPVTEVVMGVDLVRLQIEIAAGERLRLSQLEVEPRGHAIEARLYGEDPENGFLPSTGTLEVFRPPQGPGLRNDIGVYPGWDVPPYYDSMLAKLVVHAETRPQAVARIRDALERYAVLGVTTNLGFLHWIVVQEEFVHGKTDTGFVDRHWPAPQAEPPIEVVLGAAAYELGAACDPSAGWGWEAANGYDPWRQATGWRQSGSARALVYTSAGHEYRVRATSGRSGRWFLEVEGHPDGARRDIEVERGGPGVVVLRQGSQVVRLVAVRGGATVAIAWRGTIYRLGRPAAARDALPTLSGPESRAGLSAPMPGTVVKIAVRQGQHVEEHEPLIVLEAMKMEHVIVAPHAGTVREILFDEGDLVPAGAPVVRLEAG